MLANTRVICSTYLNSWRYLPEGGSFSVWTMGAAGCPSGGCAGTVSGLRGRPDGIVTPINYSMDRSGDCGNAFFTEDSLRRLWFVLDEWDSLGKVDSLRIGLTKLRKYGGAVIAGLQTMAQLRSSYGHDEAQVLLSCFPTKLILAAGDTKTARYFEYELGTQEVELWNAARRSA
jgi:hypothetical protein